MAASLRVSVVAGDPLVRAGLVGMLQGRPGVEIAGQGAPPDTEATDLAAVDPDVILWDVGPDDGPERTVLVGARLSPVVALVSRPADAADALASGARGVLLREADPDAVVAALQAAAAGLAVSDPSLVVGVPVERDRDEVPPVEDLTPRELEVLQLLAEGLTNKEISRRLGTSEHTAKFHVNAILSKLGAHSRTEAATRAARLGLIIL